MRPELKKGQDAGMFPDNSCAAGSGAAGLMLQINKKIISRAFYGVPCPDT
jgi:hypothetical protein